MAFRWRIAHLIALSAIAVTQPVLDLLGGSPTFFVAHTASPASVLFVCLLAVAVVPVVLVTIEFAMSMVHQGWGWRLHLLLVGLLGALIASQTIDRVPAVPSWSVLLGGAGLGALLVRGYLRIDVLRSALSALTLTPLLFIAVFVFGSPVHGLIFPQEVEAAEVRVPGTPPPVFVVVFDELPLASVLAADGDDIDAERFPNLARLAGDGVWYSNATAVAGFTHEAVPAILTGDRVHAENVPPTAGGHPRNLFSLLADDYDIVANEQITQVCTPVLCERSTGPDAEVPVSVLLNDVAVVSGLVSLPAGLDGWLPDIDDSWANFGDASADLDQEADRFGDDRTDFVHDLGLSDRVGGFRSAVGQIHARSAPTLTFIHLVFPHVPWTFHADGSRYSDPGNPGLGDDDRWSTEFSADLALQRHLLQAQFADELLGEFLAQLDEEGLYDDSLVVFTADHGASLAVDTNRRVPEASTLPGIMAVPMVVKPPADQAVRGHRDDRVAEVVDLVPTIADVLGVDIPWTVDGQSLFGPPRDRTGREIYARGDTVRTDDAHLDLQPIVDHIRAVFGQTGRIELYGLGPHPELLGDRVRRHAIRTSSGGCWNQDDQVDGSVGSVRGSIETDEEAEVAFAVVVDGRIAGTSVTYDEDGDDHRLFALADPAGWGAGDQVELWRFVDPGQGPNLERLPRCP